MGFDEGMSRRQKEHGRVEKAISRGFSRFLSTARSAFQVFALMAVGVGNYFRAIFFPVIPRGQ